MPSVKIPPEARDTVAQLALASNITKAEMLGRLVKIGAMLYHKPEVIALLFEDSCAEKSTAYASS